MREREEERVRREEKSELKVKTEIREQRNR